MPPYIFKIKIVPHFMNKSFLLSSFICQKASLSRVVYFSSLFSAMHIYI